MDAQCEKSESRPPRGVAPAILLEQVRNTAPFVLDPTFAPTSRARAPYLATLAALNDSRFNSESHLDYYRLCLSAHYGTVATFVPTDVDNQIRFKLWHPILDTATVKAMAELVAQSHQWDTRPVSRRFVQNPETGAILGGHNGEWFSTAAGAYGALKRRDPDAAAEVAALITREVQFEADTYLAFKKSRNGMDLLRTATLMAHNLGDLERVFEMWNIADADPVRDCLRGQSQPALTEAGELNKLMMASENHRHFALRAPRGLRVTADFLLPLAPFLDSWGRAVARHPQLRPEEVADIVHTLVIGWEKLRDPTLPQGGPVGYARAIAGIVEGFSGGMSALSNYLPARVLRSLKSGPLRAQIDVPQKRFEEQWANSALNFSKRRPSS